MRKKQHHTIQHPTGPEVKHLYCSCNNPECGHTFVMEVTFSHTLSPSAMDIPRAALEKIRQANQM